jgi:glycosyltransferase involved in cell wall biosynthesis
LTGSLLVIAFTVRVDKWIELVFSAAPDGCAGLEVCAARACRRRGLYTSRRYALDAATTLNSAAKSQAPAPAPGRLRIALCWMGVSGYMAACCRALAKTRGDDLLVIALASTGDAQAGWFDNSLLSDVNAHLLSPQERDDSSFVERLVADHRPQVVYIPGWSHKPYTNLAFSPRLSDCRFALGLDNQWKGTLKQQLARLKLARLLSRISGVMVPGERAFQFAKRLKRSDRDIYRGSYGFDMQPLNDLYEQRVAAGEWPRRFLYVGRYVDVKGFDTLLPAYRKYRAMVSDPWPLSCCGDGPLAGTIAGEPGVENLGWVQPNALPPIFARAGVFVIASWYEPWCVALAEAMGAGLPAICTEEVGASVELVRPYLNGLTVPTRDVDRLAGAMRWMHENHDRLPEMGKHAREFASAFSADLWAQRIWRMFTQIMS